jgi:hypothetical protein
MAASGEAMTVFTIIEKKGYEKPIWVKIGACFPNRDGSLNVFLDALPINGRMQIRSRKPGAKPQEQHE